MRFRAGFGAVVVALAFSASTAPAALAQSVPFEDPQANGFIGLCDREGKAIRSGDLLATPFVWTAVSSSPAPKGYEKGKATLVVFQPRDGVDPGQWSGQQLTASSTYSNAKYPMAQATNADPPLLFFTQAFPAKWKGLIQLRMYFSGVNLPNYRERYPATVLKIEDQRWSVVQGGSAPCDAGEAVSAEAETLPESVLATPSSVKLLDPDGPAASSDGDLPSEDGFPIAPVAAALATSMLALGVALRVRGGRRRRTPSDDGSGGDVESSPLDTTP